MTASSVREARFPILGVPLSVVDMRSAVDTIAGWVRRRQPRYICATDVHSVMCAQDDKRHMTALRGADMIVPDGAPLVWVSRMRGERRLSRVCGPDLLLAVCERSAAEGWRHFFVGGAEGVADTLALTLAENYPGLDIAGTECPPFRSLSDTETDAMLARIAAARPDIIWVGLGCPKQEIWMHTHHARLGGALVIGVGAAFDFHSGRTQRAPLWMRSNGLEWLHRLVSEPKRLWRRYLVLAPRFVALSLRESIAQWWAGRGGAAGDGGMRTTRAE